MTPRAGFMSSEAPSNYDCGAQTAPYLNYVNNVIKMLLKALSLFRNHFFIL